MNTEHPSTYLHFVFAFTYCKLRVYDSDLPLAKALLIAADVELFENTENTECMEVDTRLLLTLVGTAIPKILEGSVKGSVLKDVLHSFALAPADAGTSRH